VETLLLISCANSTPGADTTVLLNGPSLVLRYHDSPSVESLPHFKASLSQKVAIGNIEPQVFLSLVTSTGLSMRLMAAGPSCLGYKCLLHVRVVKEFYGISPFKPQIFGCYSYERNNET